LIRPDPPHPKPFDGFNQPHTVRLSA
jgi:hypothetical protein